MYRYNVEALSMKNSGVKANEDRYVWIEAPGGVKIAAVFDGATGRGGVDGATASSVFAEVLQTKRVDESLMQVVERANHQLAEVVVNKFEELLRHNDKLPEEQKLPNEVIDKYNSARTQNLAMTAQEKIIHIDPAFNTATCGAIVLIDEKKQEAEIIQTGDCMVGIQGTNGKIELLTEDSVSRSDYFSYLHQAIAVDELTENAKKAFDQLTESEKKLFQQNVSKQIEPTLKTGRNNANNPDSQYSYSVFNGVPIDLTKHHQKVSLQDSAGLVLLSDGLVIPQVNFQSQTDRGWQKAIETAFKKGIRGLLAVVDLLEKADPHMKLLTDRLKATDDKTAMRIMFERENERNTDVQTKLAQRAEKDIPDFSSIKVKEKNDRGVYESFQTR